MDFFHYRGAMLEVGIQGWTQQIHDHEIVFTLRSNPSWVSWGFVWFCRFGGKSPCFGLFFCGKFERNIHSEAGKQQEKQVGNQMLAASWHHVTTY